jgi:hypothetical protein
MADMMRADLTDARTHWIGEGHTEAEISRREKSAFLAYRDDAGRVADFHSLRHTFISNLAQAGVHPELTQSLARHSDINLTMSRYTHTTRGEESAALAALPDLSPDRRENAQATGTDGQANLPEVVLANCLAEKVSDGCKTVQSDAVIAAKPNRGEKPRNSREIQQDVHGTSSIDVVRLAGFEPATYGLGNRCSIP